MKIKAILRDYFCSDFLRHCLIVLNTVLFFFICFISLALDARSPFNNINIILVGVFIAITIIYMIQNKRLPRVNTFVICVIGLLTCMVVSWAVNGFESFPRPPILVTLFSLFVFLWLDNNRSHLKFYLIAFLLASWCFLLLFTIVSRSAIVHPNFSTRLGRDFGNENDVARHLVFAFLINLYFIYIFKSKVLKVCLSLVCLLTVYFIFLTGSMSNMILVLISLFVFTFLIASRKTGIIVVLLTVASIGTVVGLIFLVPVLDPIKQRVLSIFTSLFNAGEYRVDASALSRLEAAIYGFRLFLENPLFGGGFNHVVSNYMIMAHNNIAEIGADYGVFAIIFEEIIILYPLIKDDNSSDNEKILTGIFGFYILLIQLFLVVFNSKVEAILLPLLFVSTNDKESFCKYNLFRKRKENKLEIVQKENMTIVEVIPSLLHINGAERLICNLSKCFTKEKHKVVFISLYNEVNEEVSKELKAKGIEIIYLNKKPGINFRCARQLRKTIELINPDIIHCHINSLLTVWLSRVFKKHKTFYTFHTLITENAVGSHKSLQNRLYRHIFLKNQVQAIAISKLVKESICKFYRLPDQTISVVENGVPLEVFSNDIALNRREYDFIFIGRFIELKNTTTIVSAFNELNKEYPDIKMLMVGEGVFLEECKRKASKNITFTGFVNDVSWLLKKSKVLLLASSHEGNPMVINEAIASRCFVVATKVGGVCDVINENNGTIIEYSENLESDLIDAMRKCIKSYKIIDEKVKKNYLNNCKKVSLETTCEKYLSIFKECKQ